MAAEGDAFDVEVEGRRGGGEVDEGVYEIGDRAGGIDDVAIPDFAEGDLLECFDCSGYAGVFVVGFFDGSELVRRRVCGMVSLISRDTVTANSPTITGP